MRAAAGALQRAEEASTMLDLTTDELRTTTYAFVFEFDDDARIRRIWEHWDTLTATRVLFRREP